MDVKTRIKLSINHKNNGKKIKYGDNKGQER
jgi:hypothetical protein